MDISGLGKKLVIVSGAISECKVAYKAIPGISRNLQNNKQVCRQAGDLGGGVTFSNMQLDLRLGFVKRSIRYVINPLIVVVISATSPKVSLAAPNYWIQGGIVILESCKIITSIQHLQ